MSKHRSERENGQPKVLRSIADYDRLALAREKTIAEPKAMGERVADQILHDVAQRLTAAR